MSDVITSLSNALRAIYTEQYNSVQPIPYIKDRKYCVKDVFVEEGLALWVTTSTGAKHGKGQWVHLESHKSILTDGRMTSTHCVIEGESGYGKSTLARKLAYDWCNGVHDSPMSKIDVLINLRLSQLADGVSIFKAMKQSLPPRYKQLTEKDIKTVVRNASSVLVILESDGMQVEDDMLSQSNVLLKGFPINTKLILTTRVLPRNVTPTVQRLRLIGFDRSARETYIRNVLRCDDDTAMNRMTELVGDNPILGELPRVPLLFVMFAHAIHENKNLENITSLTFFFKNMVTYFFEHIKKTMEEKDSAEINQFMNDHSKLDKLIFDHFSRVYGTNEWSGRDLNVQLGKRFLECYIKSGILQEEQISDGTEPSHLKSVVSFYHKIFNEWFAAHYLSGLFSDTSSLDKILDILVNFDPFELQYMYRFTCGINPAAAKYILEYLDESNEWERLVVLCSLEKEGSADGIRTTIEEMCSNEVAIADYNTSFLQRTTVQILEIASKKQIKIKRLVLVESLSSVDVYSSEIVLMSVARNQTPSDIRLPPLETLEHLWIDDRATEFNEEIITGIYLYASKCTNLQNLTFSSCFLPRSFIVSPTLAKLHEMGIEVQWEPMVVWYRLITETGKWEYVCGSVEITEDELQREHASYREFYLL